MDGEEALFVEDSSRDDQVISKEGAQEDYNKGRSKLRLRMINETVYGTSRTRVHFPSPVHLYCVLL